MRATGLQDRPPGMRNSRGRPQGFVYNLQLSQDAEHLLDLLKSQSDYGLYSDGKNGLKCMPDQRR